MSELTFAARLIHPLDDAPEPKLYHEKLGRMRMSASVRLSLLVLRLYLVAMVALVGWRALELAGAV
ncbi:MAG: hypothetical protein J2P47_16565 [Acetobacteraceae bacterium]|nr:hypothetical protein [Acetobacteraceae bacterium]